MKRKTSKLPSRVYKYRIWPPTLGANLVEETFVKGRWYFNQYVTIENRRRQLYRAARARLQPPVDVLTKELDALNATRREVGKSIKQAKAEARSRAVPAELVSQMLAVRARIRLTSRLLGDEIEKGKDDPLLLAAAEPIDAEANEAVKALRKTLYWGTYLLIEDAADRSKADTRGDLSYKETPIHQLHGRIGIQIQGGLTVPELVDDTRIQLRVPRMELAGSRPSRGSGRLKPRGKFRLRVGTVPGGREPIWAEFQVAFHRALPEDAVVKWAVVTRRPGHLYRPWIYHLCLTVESDKFERTSGDPRQKGTTAINFGWRKEDDTLRVATINNNASSELRHVHLPREIYDRFDITSSLQSTIDSHFEVAKRELGEWVVEHRETLPDEFMESVAYLTQWKEPRRLSEVVKYWREHRLPDDDGIFPVLWAWRGKWIHLYQWCTCNRRRAINSRTDFYRRLADEVTRASTRIAVENFCISRVAEHAAEEEEETGGQLARENRTRAAVSDLRTFIHQAAAKNHCETALVKAVNNTRRCNKCGQVFEWDPAKELVRRCPDCSTWDQDANNTANIHDRVASGEVVLLVRPAKIAEDGKIESSEEPNFPIARKKLDNLKLK
jgi:predicted Zn-ribbon and HTH transcriptional regulator